MNTFKKIIGLLVLPMAFNMSMVMADSSDAPEFSADMEMSRRHHHCDDSCKNHHRNRCCRGATGATGAQGATGAAGATGATGAAGTPSAPPLLLSLTTNAGQFPLLASSSSVPWLNELSDVGFGFTPGAAATDIVIPATGNYLVEYSIAGVPLGTGNFFILRRISPDPDTDLLILNYPSTTTNDLISVSGIIPLQAGWIVQVVYTTDPAVLGTFSAPPFVLGTTSASAVAATFTIIQVN